VALTAPLEFVIVRSPDARGVGGGELVLEPRVGADVGDGQPAVAIRDVDRRLQPGGRDVAEGVPDVERRVLGHLDVVVDGEGDVTAVPAALGVDRAHRDAGRARLAHLDLDASRELLGLRARLGRGADARAHPDVLRGVRPHHHVAVAVLQPQRPAGEQRQRLVEVAHHLLAGGARGEERAGRGGEQQRERNAREHRPRAHDFSSISICSVLCFSR
jgi:hypothetical protein